MISIKIFSLVRLVKLDALQTLLQVERVKIIESHQVPIPRENIHFLLPDIHCLPVPSAGLFPNDEPMRLIVHYFLF